MKNDDAAREIVNAFRRWVREQNLTSPNGTDALLFFSKLQTAHSPLLDFRAAGDKWQHVHGWLLRAGAVGD